MQEKEDEDSDPVFEEQEQRLYQSRNRKKKKKKSLKDVINPKNTDVNICIIFRRYTLIQGNITKILK